MSEPIHPSLYLRKIIHFDMDAFYASIEIRDNPSLKGRPVVVGGSPKSRGVVCTASYEARRFGIHSAMPCSKAARLCPDAIFLKPDFSKYSRVSDQIRGIFRQYTAIIEPLSLDEAYLDVTNNSQGLFAVKIAKMIQEDIRRHLGLSGSAGVAPNKLLAKIASDLRKPGGISVVLPEQVHSFMGPLPLRKIHGIGPVTNAKLQAVGYNQCRDIWAIPLHLLEKQIGNLAPWLFNASRGIDERPLQTTWERKSLGKEETFQRDSMDTRELEQKLFGLCLGIVEDLAQEDLQGRTITLKVKYNDFRRITRSRSLPHPTGELAAIFNTAKDLLGHTEAGQRAVRLLGISLSNLEKTVSVL